MSSHPQRKVVVYTRYSSEMQREESCEDQEREVRDELTRKGLDHQNAVVLADKAKSGEVVDRRQFQKLLDMIDRGEVAVLAVDNQSRLTRAGASDAYSIVKDIVYHGGRFISVEGIDTDEAGWELLVQVKGITHNAENRDRAKAVRRNQKGRAEKPEASVGDQCYGFATKCDDPNWTYSKKDPKPRKHNIVMEDEARWVRKVFHWFVVDLWSILKITRKLNELGVPKGHRSSRPGWHHHQVRRMLSNPKYVGRWLWGKTRTVRNSRGKKKQLPVPAKDVVVTDRPELRIIDDKTWDAAQKKLANLAKVYGKKKGQKPRGPRVHHTSVYPSSLLGGLLHCGECGARLVYQTGGTDVYFGCPAHRKGTCPQATRAPREKTEKVLLDFFVEELRGVPGWLGNVMSNLEMFLKELDTRVPQELEAKSTTRDDLQKKVENITAAIESGGAQSVHLTNRVAEHDERIARLDAENDPEANHAAAAHGYEVLAGGALMGDEWRNAKRFESFQAASQVFPTDRPTSGSGTKYTTIPQEKWTPGMRRLAEYVERIGRELVGGLVVRIVRDSGNRRFSAWYGGKEITFNVQRLGHRFFNDFPANMERVNALLLHETAHERESDHLSDRYHTAICDFGARLTQLALERPKLFSESRSKERGS